MKCFSMKARRSSVSRDRDAPARSPRRILVLLLGVMVTLVAAPVTAAQAEPLGPAITSPENASVTNNQTPTISGTTEGLLELGETTVTVRIYAGASHEGKPTVELPPVPVVGNTWSATPAQALPPGAYTVQAEDSEVP